MAIARGGRGRAAGRESRQARQARQGIQARADQRSQVDADLVTPAPKDPKYLPATPSPEGLALPGRSRWERLVVGRPGAEVEPVPPPPETYHPDTVCDGWSAGGLTLRLASVRGDAHRAGGVPRQDDAAATVHPPTGVLAFAVAGGVATAPKSHVGSVLACRAAVADVMRQLDGGAREVDWLRVLRAACHQLLARFGGNEPATEAHRERATRELATTLLAGTVTPATPQAESAGDPPLVEILPFGDSSAWLLRGGLFQPLIAGKGTGQERERTRRDDAQAADGAGTAPAWHLPRVPRAVEPLKAILPPDGVLLAGTDGIGDPLGDGTGSVGRVLASRLAEPPRGPGALAQLLDFSREGCDDDRTLLAVWPRPGVAGRE